MKKRRLIWAIAFYSYILGLFSMRAKMDKTNSIAKLLPSLECNPIYGTLCHKCSWNAILHVESDNYYDTFPLLNWITNSLLIFFLEMHLFRSLFYVLTYVEQNCTNIIDTPSIQPIKWRIFFWVCWAKLCDFGFSTFHVSKTPKLGIKFQCKNSFYPNMHRM